MNNLRRFAMACLALILVISGTGLTFSSAQAATCVAYHTVKPGESLSWIGRWYGVSWPAIAHANGISWPNIIYVGQVLCIPGGGVPPSPGVVSTAWGYSVVGVVQNTSVTIRTSNMPDNVLFAARIGRLGSGGYEWRDAGNLDSGRGGRLKATFNIPAEFAGTPSLVIRLTQAKKNISVDRWFGNIPGWSGTGGPGTWYPWWHGGIPTIWIVSVVRDSTVTVRTNNFPANVSFDVLMGPMGTRGIGGYYVTTFNSGAGGTQVLTFNIPAQLHGSYRIAIRTQSPGTGYFSYNWFYNNTAVDP